MVKFINIFILKQNNFHFRFIQRKIRTFKYTNFVKRVKIITTHSFYVHMNSIKYHPIKVLVSFYRARKKPYRNLFNLNRISRPGLRIYSNYQQIPRILGGMGIIILSTSQGIMTDREARLEGIGG